ncbi:MAG: zf-HC2 domain-containing protein [Acidobacteriota bacterium]|jgi:anti-sigma factor RsiW
MSCRARHEEIALLVGGELTDSERTAVEEHLKTCAGCRELAAALRDDRRALASLATEEPPPEALVRIREGLREELRHGAGADDRSRRRVWLALAAAIVAAAVGLELWTGLHERDAGTADAPRVARDRAPAGSSREAPGGRPRPADRPAAGPPPAPASTPDPPPDPGATREPDRLATTGTPERAPGPPGPPEPPGMRPARTDPSATDAPITIRIVSDDPDIVFYWLTDEPKESTDEATV